MKKSFLLVALFCLAFAKLVAQDNDPVLFSVNGKPVHLSEFNYIYSKTNGVKADYSRASVEEYLDLYTKFKMKVARAREMQLDTIPAVQEELQMYRRQLADSYLTDKEVTERLVKELYDRVQYDVNISHIFFKADKDQGLALSKAQVVLVRLEKGEAFEAVAKETSEDDNSKNNGGKLGFITAMLPDGFHELEAAIYATPVGKWSKVIRSPMGYHIVKVNETRPARGEIEAAHIMLRKVKEGVEQPWAKARMDSIYGVLKAGGNFEELAQKFSDDSYSAPRGGYLGSFGIGRYDIGFENAAFGIERDGDFSEVYESPIGFHIIKRITKRGIQPFETVKSALKARVQQDSRHGMARQALLARIKTEGGFSQNPKALEDYIKSLDSTFMTYNWIHTPIPNQALMSFGENFKITTDDFHNYLLNNPNNRVTYSNDSRDYKMAVRRMYAEYVDDRALAYEETQLEKKYPDFRNLMREYEEGILLFEAIKQNVWDKASLDSAGLEKFFQTRRDRFTWDERASLIYYTISDSAKAAYSKIKKFAEKKSVSKVLEKFNAKNKNVITFREETVEKGKAKILDGAAWKAGTIIESKDAPLNFVKIEKIIPKGPKLLNEARGFVVAEYQEHLEKLWIDELKSKYKLDIDQKVLSSIIK